MMNGVRFVILLATLSYTPEGTAASIDTPRSLVNLGQRVKCPVLSKRPQDTPWGPVTLWTAEREVGTAYAAWCARGISGSIGYDLLVITVSLKHPWAACPQHVRLGMSDLSPQLRATLLPRDFPYQMTLRDFWYLGKHWLDDREPAGGLEIPSGPALDFGLGMAGQILMCFNGRWIMTGYH